MLERIWGWIRGFGWFWYGFIIGDDWMAAAGVAIMLGAAYGLILLGVTAWWAGPVVITVTTVIVLRRSLRRQRRPAQPEGPPTGRNLGGVMDITELILNDHRDQRRMFALLDEVGSEPAKLEPIWERLAILLEVHAAAEEQLFYPHLLDVGAGADGGESPAEETKDAIRDHNDIRDGVHRAREHPVGSREWWQAVTDARIANSDHMAEEEREALADFRRHASLQTRHDLAAEFAAFEAAHASGIRSSDKDPARYIEQQRG